MARRILKDLPELVEAGVITGMQANAIADYYRQKPDASPHRLVFVFGVLGSLLTGLGAILIIAHNWDDFSKAARLTVALFPLLAAQALCGYALLRRKDSELWMEGAAVFLCCAVAASIAVVSQVYHLPSNLADFFLIWMLLSIPLIYLMRAGATSLLVICGITVYACLVSYSDYPGAISWYYWLMLAAIIPFYLTLPGRNRPVFFNLHGWFIALSLVVTTGMFSGPDDEFMYVTYLSLFSFMVLLGGMDFFSREKLLSNPFLVTGSVGSVVLLLTLSFKWIWIQVSNVGEPGTSFASAIVMSLLAGSLLAYEVRKKGWRGVHAKGGIFLLFLVVFAIGMYQPEVAQWLVNILVLWIGIQTVRRGALGDNMLILNYGLLILSALVLCRFFDTALSFVVRGLLFMLVGLSFFVANYRVMKRRKFNKVL